MSESRVTFNAEEVLPDERNFVAAVLDTAATLVVVLDTQGRIVVFNQACQQTTAYSAEEVRGRPFWDLFLLPEEVESVKAVFKNLQAGQFPNQYDNYWLTRDRDRRLIAWSNTALLDSSGGVKYIIGTGIDITERHQAEQALKKAKAELEIRVEERTAELRKANEQLQEEMLERQRTELALEQSYRLLQAVIEGTPDAIFVKDLQYRVVMANSGFGTIFNRQVEEIIGKDNTELLPPEIARQINETDRRVMTSGEPEMVEEVVTIMGITKIYLSTKSVLRDPSGNVIGLVGVSRDITERKAAEEALRESEERYRHFIETALEGIWVIDAENKTIFVNRTLAEMLGYSIEEMQGKSLFDFMDDEGKAIAARQVELRRQGIEAKIDFKLCRKDGSFRWAIVSTSPIFDSAGNYAGAFAMITDITDRRQAEEALRESEARLREQARRENLLNRLASQIRNSLNLDKVLETTVQEIRNLLQIERCHFAWYYPDREEPGWAIVKEARNSELSDLRGYYPIAAVGSMGQKLLNLEMLRIDDIEKLSQKPRSAAQPSEKPRSVAYASDRLWRKFLRSMGFASILVLPIQTRSGTIGILSCCQSSAPRPWRDWEVELLHAVTDQLAIAINQAELYAATRTTAKQFQEQAAKLEQTLSELQQTQAQLVQTEKMSSLGQLVAGIAHEINNPVNFIYGNLAHTDEYTKDLLNLLQLYQQHYFHPVPEIQDEMAAIDLDFLIEDLPKMLTSMKVGAERIRQIVLSLRNFSRLDEAEMKAVDVHEGIESSLLILQNRLKTKPDHPGIQLIKEYGDLPQVECYAGQLNQVFMNLLTNAIDALEERIERGEENTKSYIPKICIRTSVVNSDRVLISIADNGLGMTEAMQKQLFNPFFTTKPVGKGTGLGLSISYQIVVEKHGGQLHCLSEPGQGTEFAIAIPIQQHS
ncbi:PAS domain S-box protein [Coleofasciculus sp. FACHB-SPT36]|uniref:PAS domain S-box protein n=1 Tax=Cyanophyceae TaxID=3028117 RepID=UPI00168BD058|nr:PAS domain S-box protein [Coleofasciculus sp. FACHB-SPT36]MBD2537841.1 PAS domain S-box protein [Coleofasciculus sp. FACHB-SPT36]